MAVIQCTQGHYYDDVKYSSCPHCNGASPVISDRKVIRFGATAPSDEKTIGVFKKRTGSDPVTGWLICVSGPERGRDYRLHSGRNFVGRAPNMDISITDDTQISREDHFSVVYDPKSRAFMLVPGSSNTYLNGEHITEPIILNIRDKIGAGTSVFVFMAFCGEDFSW